MLHSWGRPLGSLASLIAQSVKNLPAVQETQLRSLGREDPLEKEMATHSSIPAWRIPWTGESGSPWGYKSGQNLTTKPPPLGLIENGETGVQKRKNLASRSHSNPILVWLCPVATIRIKGHHTPSTRLTLLKGKAHREHQKSQGTFLSHSSWLKNSIAISLLPSQFLSRRAGSGGMALWRKLAVGAPGG